jgi:cytochrome c553
MLRCNVSAPDNRRSALGDCAECHDKACPRAHAGRTPAAGATRFAFEQLILNQLKFKLIGPLFDCTKWHVAHS